MDHLFYPHCNEPIPFIHQEYLWHLPVNSSNLFSSSATWYYQHHHNPVRDLSLPDAPEPGIRMLLIVVVPWLEEKSYVEGTKKVCRAKWEGVVVVDHLRFWITDSLSSFESVWNFNRSRRTNYVKLLLSKTKHGDNKCVSEWMRRWLVNLYQD